MSVAWDGGGIGLEGAEKLTVTVIEVACMYLGGGPTSLSVHQDPVSFAAFVMD